MAERLAGILPTTAQKALKNNSLHNLTGWPEGWPPHSDTLPLSTTKKIEMIKKQNTLPFEALTKGYILLPKHLMETLLSNIDRPMTDFEAILTLLTKVNYKDTLCYFEGKKIMCKRGEALYSTKHWAEIFCWTRAKTRRFLDKLVNEKIIEILPTLPHETTHLRVLNYDLWTGSSQEARKRKREKEDERFEEYWEMFHRITCTRKVNRGRAEREWHRMTTEEQDCALRRINDYYYSLTDIRFCKQAATYLSDKAYLNE